MSNTIPARKCSAVDEATKTLNARIDDLLQRVETVAELFVTKLEVVQAERDKLAASLAQRVEEQELVIDQRLTALEVSVNAEREELDLFAAKVSLRVQALEEQVMLPDQTRRGGASMRQLTKRRNCVETMIVTDDGQVLDMPLRCPFAWSQGGQSHCGDLCVCYDERVSEPPAGDGKTYVHCAATYNRVLGELIYEQMTHTDFFRQHIAKRRPR